MVSAFHNKLDLAILMFVAIASVFSVTQAVAQALPQQPSQSPSAVTDPCQLAGNALVAPSPANSFHLSFSDPDVLLGLAVSKAQRLTVMCELKNAVLNNYSLVQLKKERLGIDADQLMQNCARNELTIDDNDRQDFLDRVEICVAGFQDTHFSASARINRPTVLTAIIATDIGGKVIISRQSPLLIARIKADDPDKFNGLEDFLAPGNEITQINGAPAAVAVDQLLPYTLGSSPAFSRVAATQSLFVRSFQYPVTRTISVEVKQSSGRLHHLELPWFVQLAAGNYDAQVKFKALGFPVVNELQMIYDPTAHKYVKNDDSLWTVGYTSKQPMFSEVATYTTYNDDDGNPGLRTGEVIIDANHAFCYMQLLTFSSVNLTVAGTAIKNGFMAPIESFISVCEIKKLPLILDLKFNLGGNGIFPARLLSILTPPEARYGGTVSAFPATTPLIDLLAQGIVPNSTGARDHDRGPDQDLIMTVLGDAIHNRQGTTDILNEPDVTADPKVGGYRQKILAVIGPLCISACDMTAHLLKNSGRALLFGAPSNGTGAGYISQNKLDSNFQDSLGLLKFSIPNFLFGIETKAGDPERLTYAANKDLLVENRPAPVDVLYHLTSKDLSSNGSWLERAALQALFAKE